MNEIWIEVSIHINSKLNLREDPDLNQLIDVISDFLVSNLNRGVIVDDHTIIKGFFTPQEFEGELFSELQHFLNDLKKIHGEHLDFQVNTRQILEEDWKDGWKAFFKPLKVADRLVIKPTWEDYIPEKGEIIIEIDPGQAFGTGTHASTRLCLELLQEHMKKNEAQKILDCGTGTGILGIAAAKLGAKSVLMIDVDPVAVDVARENCELNRVQHVCSVSTTPIWEIEDSFNIILANLDKNTLILLSKDLVRVLAPKGSLICSGIIKGQERDLIERFTDMGLNFSQFKEDKVDPEWLGIVFQRD